MLRASSEAPRTAEPQPHCHSLSSSYRVLCKGGVWCVVCGRQMSERVWGKACVRAGGKSQPESRHGVFLCCLMLGPSHAMEVFHRDIRMGCACRHACLPSRSASGVEVPVPSFQEVRMRRGERQKSPVSSQQSPSPGKHGYRGSTGSCCCYRCSAWKPRGVPHFEVRDVPPRAFCLFPSKAYYDHLPPLGLCKASPSWIESCPKKCMWQAGREGLEGKCRTACHGLEVRLVWE